MTRATLHLIAAVGVALAIGFAFRASIAAATPSVAISTMVTCKTAKEVLAASTMTDLDKFLSSCKFKFQMVRVLEIRNDGTALVSASDLSLRYIKL